MATLLLRHAAVLVTMDAHRREIADGAVFARDGWIEEVGPTEQLPTQADTVVDLTGHLVLPGLVNTHHHLFQTLTRAVPGAQDAGLFDWLKTLYPIWGRLRAEDLRLATQVGLVELARSGCTTVFDHGYLFPNDCRLDDEFEAAAEVGVRLHAARGSMSLGRSAGGLPPDDLVEATDAILDDTERVIDAYHDHRRGAMTRVVVAPCSPFSVTEDLMKASAELARDRGVRLHTHLAETRDEEAFCRERYGRTPLAYAADVGWLDRDVLVRPRRPHRRVRHRAPRHERGRRRALPVLEHATRIRHRAPRRLPRRRRAGRPRRGRVRVQRQRGSAG